MDERERSFLEALTRQTYGIEEDIPITVADDGSITVFLRGTIEVIECTLKIENTWGKPDEVKLDA